jgi:hypothetical protein
MGSCISAPSFAATTSADLFHGHAAPSEGDFEEIGLIPADSFLSANCAVFAVPSTIDSTPLYVFEPSMGSFSLVKVDPMTGKKETLATIKQGWQTSKGYSVTTGAINLDPNVNNMGQHEHSVTTSAKKKLTVVSKISGVEQKIQIEKFFDRNESGKNFPELSGGWVLEEKEGGLQLSFVGKIMAAMYEPNVQAMTAMTMGATTSSMQGAKQYLKAPSGLYLRKNLSEEEKV